MKRLTLPAAESAGSTDLEWAMGHARQAAMSLGARLPLRGRRIIVLHSHPGLQGAFGSLTCGPSRIE